MSFFRRVCLGILILSFICLQCPNVIFAAQDFLLAQANPTGITSNPPEMLGTPEEKIPQEMVKKDKSNTWLYLLGGAVLIGGAVALAGGGGGGDGSPPPVTTGDISVTW